MKKTLIVVDMQNDFIDMALGTPEAQAIVPRVKAKIEAAVALPENVYVKYGFPIVAYYYEEYGLYFYYTVDQNGKLLEFPEYYLQLDSDPSYTATIDGDTVTFRNYYG